MNQLRPFLRGPRSLPPSAAAVGLLIIAPSLLHAAGAGHEPAIGDLFWPWINFLVYVVLITFLLKPKISPAWRARRERIAGELTAAQNEINSAKERLSEIHGEIALFNERAETIQATRRKQAQDRCAKILSDARQKAQWVANSAKQLIESERKLALDDVKEDLVTLALEKARAAASGVSKERFRTYDRVALERVDELTVH